MKALFDPIRPLAAAVLVVLAPWPAACTSDGGPARMQTTTSTMAGINELLDEGETRLDAVVVSLDRMERSDDLRRSFRQFEQNLDAIEDTAAEVRERRVALQANAAEHIIQWRAEERRIEGERAQDISDERRREFERTVGDVASELDDLNAAYDPLITRLRDLRRLLSNDLTVRGVESARPLRREAIELAEQLRARTADARAQIEEARRDFAR